MNTEFNFVNKKLIAFDVDGTLSPPRGKIDEEMAELLSKLLFKKKVAIITGGTLDHIKQQVLNLIPLIPEQKQNLTLLPTNGGSLFIAEKEWKEISSSKFSIQEKEKIIRAIKEMEGKYEELKNNKFFGEEIQDRLSEITYSALGDKAPFDLKKAWDPDFKKRLAIQKDLAEKLPDFEVKIGGSTSIDITAKGMDKAVAIKKLMNFLGLKQEEILFLGDAVYENGNDFPVYQKGIDTIKVSSPEDTKKAIREILR